MERALAVTEGTNQLSSNHEVEDKVQKVVVSGQQSASVPGSWDGRTAARVVYSVFTRFTRPDSRAWYLHKQFYHDNMGFLKLVRPFLRDGSDNGTFSPSRQRKIGCREPRVYGSFYRVYGKHLHCPSSGAALTIETTTDRGRFARHPKFARGCCVEWPLGASEWTAPCDCHVNLCSKHPVL
jgi:hypothetical protein